MIAIVGAVLLCAALLVTYQVHRQPARSTGASAGAPSGQTSSLPSGPTTAASVPGGAGQAGSGPAGTSAPAADPTTGSTRQPTSPAPGPLSPGDVPAGFRRVRGPEGLEVTIPAGWPVHPGAVPQNRQADAPDGSGRFVRFGTTPAPSGNLLSALETDEATNPSIRQDYQRVQLAPVTYGSAQEAVDWEFTFTKKGQARHAYGRYWVYAGSEYVVYLSTPAASWNTTQNVLNVLLETASPVG